MKKGPYKMKGYSYPGSAPTRKTTQEERDEMTPSERLLARVPDEDAYNKLTEDQKKGFNTAAKEAGLPTKYA